MKSSQPRLMKMSLSPFGIGWLHKRNPWVALACSIALPGLGHFYCGAYIRGFTLMTWEIVVNQMSRLNLTIFLTAMGHADKARMVVDFDWLLIYPVFYVLAMWDSYRIAVELNVHTELEQRQANRQFTFMGMSHFEFAFLGKRNPWMAAFLALMLGGGGHFYNFKIAKAIMLMSWHMSIWLNAGINQAIIAMLHGDWVGAHQAIDYQWMLFFPSIHIFNIYDAYSDAVALNTLYDEAIECYLRESTGQEKPAGGVSCATGPSLY